MKTLTETYLNIYKEDTKLSALKGFVNNNKFEVLKSDPTTAHIFDAYNICGSFIMKEEDLIKIIGNPSLPTRDKRWFIKWGDGLFGYIDETDLGSYNVFISIESNGNPDDPNEEENVRARELLSRLQNMLPVRIWTLDDD